MVDRKSELFKKLNISEPTDETRAFYSNFDLDTYLSKTNDNLITQLATAIQFLDLSERMCTANELNMLYVQIHTAITFGELSRSDISFLLNTFYELYCLNQNKIVVDLNEFNIDEHYLKTANENLILKMASLNDYISRLSPEMGDAIGYSVSGLNTMYDLIMSSNRDGTLSDKTIANLLLYEKLYDACINQVTLRQDLSALTMQEIQEYVANSQDNILYKMAMLEEYHRYQEGCDYLALAYLYHAIQQELDAHNASPYFVHFIWDRYAALCDQLLQKDENLNGYDHYGEAIKFLAPQIDLNTILSQDPTKQLYRDIYLGKLTDVKNDLTHGASIESFHQVNTAYELVARQLHKVTEMREAILTDSSNSRTNIIEFIKERDTGELTNLCNYLESILDDSHPYQAFKKAAVQSLHKLMTEYHQMGDCVRIPFYRPDATVSIPDPEHPENILTIFPGELSHLSRAGGGAYGDAYRCRYVGKDENIKKLCTLLKDKNGNPYLDAKGNPHYWLIIKEPKRDANMQPNPELISSFNEEVDIVNGLSKAWFAKPDHSDNTKCAYNLACGGTVRTGEVESSVIISAFECESVEIDPITSELNPQGGNLEGYLGERYESTQGGIAPHVSEETLNYYHAFTRDSDIICAQIMGSVYHSLEEINALNYLHLDMALRNALITNTGFKDGIPISFHAKVADFGYGKYLGEAHAMKEGRNHFAVRWADPRRTKMEEINAASDIHSFKATFVEYLGKELGFKSNFILTPHKGTLQEGDFLETAHFIIGSATSGEVIQNFSQNVELAVARYNEDNPNSQIAKGTTALLTHFAPYLNEEVSLKADSNHFYKCYNLFFIHTLQTKLDTYDKDNDLKGLLTSINRLLALPINELLFSETQQHLFEFCKHLAANHPLKQNEIEQHKDEILQKIVIIKDFMRNPDILKSKEIILDEVTANEKITLLNETIEKYQQQFKIANDAIKAGNFDSLSHAQIKACYETYQAYAAQLGKLKSTIHSYVIPPQCEESIKQALEKIKTEETLLADSTEQIWKTFNKLYDQYKDDTLTILESRFKQQLEQYAQSKQLASSRQFNRIDLGIALGCINDIKQTLMLASKFGLTNPRYLAIENQFKGKAEIEFWGNIIKPKLGNKDYKNLWHKFLESSKAITHPSLRNVNEKLEGSIFAEHLLKIANQFSSILGKFESVKSLEDAMRSEEHANEILHLLNSLTAKGIMDKNFSELESIYKSSFAEEGLSEPELKTLLANAAFSDPALHMELQKYTHATKQLHDMLTILFSNKLQTLKNDLPVIITKRTKRPRNAAMAGKSLIASTLDAYIAKVSTLHNPNKNELMDRLTGPGLDLALQEKDSRLLEKTAEAYHASVHCMANTLIAMDKAMFTHLNVDEFYHTHFSNPEMTPTIINASQQFDHVSRYIAADILNQATLENQTLSMEYWINVAYQCLHHTSLSSLNAAYMINAALEKGFIERLTPIKEGLSPDAKAKLHEIQTLINSTNDNNARQFINSNPHTIPFIGIYQSDAEQMKTEDGVRNDASAYQLNKKIRQQIANVRTSDFSFEPAAEFIQLLSTYEGESDEKLLRRSLEIEPSISKNERSSRKGTRVEIRERGETNVRSKMLASYLYKNEDIKPLKSITKDNPTQDETTKVIIVTKENAPFAAHFLVDPYIQLVMIDRPGEDNRGALLPYCMRVEVSTDQINHDEEILPLVLKEYNNEHQKAITIDDIFVLDTYANDIIENKSHHAIQDAELIESPSLIKVMSIFYLLQKDGGAYFKLPQGKEEEVEIKRLNNKIAMAQVFFEELKETDATILESLLLTQAAHNPNLLLFNLLPQSIKSIIAKKYLMFDEPPDKLTLSQYLPNDMNKYTYVGKKSGGRNDAGKQGGLYKHDYKVLTLKETEPQLYHPETTLYHQKILFKQDTKSETNIRHEKNIAEFVTGRIMNALIGDKAASIILATRPTENSEGIPLPDASGENVYIGSIYYDDFKEFFKLIDFSDRPPLMEYMMRNRIANVFKEDPDLATGFPPVSVAALLAGDFDLHTGNIGKDSKGFKKIDHGAGLHHLTDDVHIHSESRHPPTGVVNHFLDFPRELKISKEYADELLRQANHPLDKDIKEILNEVNSYYGIEPILSFAERAGMDIKQYSNGLKAANKLEVNAKLKMENSIKQTLTLELKDYLTHKIHMRQRSLQELAMEIKVSLSVNNNNTGFLTKIDQLIDEDPLYFLKGNYHFRREDQATTIPFFGRMKNWGTHNQLSKLLTDKVITHLEVLIDKAQNESDPSILEHIIANEKFRAAAIEAKIDLKQIYQKLLQNIVEKLTNNPQNLSHTVIDILISEKSTDHRTLMLERWILIMNLAMQKDDLPTAIAIYEGLTNPAISSLHKTWEGLSDEAKHLFKSTGETSSFSALPKQGLTTSKFLTASLEPKEIGPSKLLANLDIKTMIHGTEKPLSRKEERKAEKAALKQQKAESKQGEMLDKISVLLDDIIDLLGEIDESLKEKERQLSMNESMRTSHNDAIQPEKTTRKTSTR